MGTEVAKIQFHGAELVVQRGETPETTFVAMKPVVEGMGLAWQPQHAKLKEHPVLAQGITEIVIPSAGGPQAMTALPLNRLHFWLATLHPNKIKDPHIREKVLIFQTEAADALFEKFFGPVIARGSADHLDDLPPSFRRIIGGIVKAVARAELAELKEAIGQLRDRNTAATFDFAGRFSASQIISLAGVPEEGRARGAAQRVTSMMLRDYSARAVRVPLHLNPRQPWMFDAADARKWLQEGGAQLICQHHDEHQARRRRPGQAELKLV